uniref:NAD(P)/FAD-dependent oxidoreductase n=1 Tax=Actinomadura fibrosa TaxID=111802 RepID=UPI0010416F74
MARRPAHDVLILGSGLAGSIAGACLARAGLDVLIIDAGHHPRFAVGESTIPYTSTMTRLIAERYGVPEIKHLSTYESVQAHISTNCGVKRNFGFLHHEPGRPHDPARAHQFPISKIAHTESHFLRADVDHWLARLAQRYGARLREDTRVADVRESDEAMTLVLADGEEIEGRFLIDASGFRSPLAQRFGLREEPTRLRTHSRSIFTHMTGVAPFESTLPSPRSHGNPSPWSEGTLHHLFPGGWMWVIPFDNHARATSDLCSVGISYDPRIHPKPDDGPQAEFDRFLADYPDVRRQFTGAEAVRPWVSTGRLQYSSTRTVGARWCLTAHAAGFIDALFSRGMQNTMVILHALIWRIIDAMRDDDFTVERFKAVEELEQGLLDVNDFLVAGAYTSFGHWELWDAWFRIWETGQVLSTMEVGRAYARFLAERDPRVLDRLARIEADGALPEYPPVRELMSEADRLVRDVQEGRRGPADAAAQIFARLAEADFVPPPFGLADRDRRWFSVTPARVARTLLWARLQAPPEIGRLFAEGIGLAIAEGFAAAGASVVVASRKADACAETEAR